MIRDFLLRSNYDFFTSSFAIVELFKHKEKLLRYSKLSEAELLELLYMVLKKLKVVSEELITAQNWKKAYVLCERIDIKDISFVALALELEGVLWTGDKRLKKGLIEKGYDNFFHPPMSIISEKDSE
jgi:predicted nucleic acid-binding protein